MESTVTTTLDDFVDLTELLPSVQQTFPTKDSLSWFIRRHRETLVAAGALIVITGRLRFHRQRFKEVAVDIGRNLAMGGAA